jgi:hypothetical protein
MTAIGCWAATFGKTIRPVSGAGTRLGVGLGVTAGVGDGEGGPEGEGRFDGLGLMTGCCDGDARPLADAGGELPGLTAVATAIPMASPATTAPAASGIRSGRLMRA